MNTGVALMPALGVKKVLRQTELAPGCPHQTLSVPPRLLPTMPTKTHHETIIKYIIIDAKASVAAVNTFHIHRSWAWVSM